MAAKKTVEPGENGRMTITLQRARPGEDATMFVCINGKNYLIPKGKAVDVPPEVAAEVLRAQAADEAFHEKAEAMQQAALA